MFALKVEGSHLRSMPYFQNTRSPGRTRNQHRSRRVCEEKGNLLRAVLPRYRLRFHWQRKINPLSGIILSGDCPLLKRNAITIISDCVFGDLVSGVASA